MDKISEFLQEECIGKTIKTMDLIVLLAHTRPTRLCLGVCHPELFPSNDQVLITFTDGARLVIEDVARQCCEQRYIETDDNLQLYEGATFTGLRVKNGDGSGADLDADDSNVVDCQFLEVNTDKGFTTFKAYNIHNGYYGGFDIRCNITKGEAPVG